LFSNDPHREYGEHPRGLSRGKAKGFTMRLSEERISHLSHLILDQLIEKGDIFVTESKEPTVRTRIKKVFLEQFRKEDEIDDKIRKKITSYKRSIPEGSSEWEILYQRFYKEEMSRKGSG
jgi:hypothetical protein